MKWAIFFAPVAVSAAVMLFASVVLTEDAEAPRRATLFERDSESEPDAELDLVALSVEGPDTEAPKVQRARKLPERQPRRAPLGGLGSRRGRVIPPPATTSSRGGFESERDDESDDEGEELSPEEKRARARKTLGALSGRLPHLKKIPGFGAIKRRGESVESEDEDEDQAESPLPEQESAPASMGGARGG